MNNKEQKHKNTKNSVKSQGDNGVSKKTHFRMRKQILIMVIALVILVMLGGFWLGAGENKNPIRLGEGHTEDREGRVCRSDYECLKVDCSFRDIAGLKEGYRPFCINKKCKCMCYGCR